MATSAFVAGCGGGDSGKRLDIADIGRTENTAISGLTKVLLEELGYEQVSVKTSDLDSVFEGVADGDLDAFQDVWLPNQQNLLGGVGDDVERLDPWYQGQTRQGIRVPSYMDATNLDHLNETEANQVLGLKPSLAVTGVISDQVIPAYDLEQKLVEASTEGMLTEVGRRINGRKDFACIA